MPPLEVHHPLHGNLVVEPGNRIIIQTGSNPFRLATIRCDSQDSGGSVLSGVKLPDDDPTTYGLRLEAILLKGDEFSLQTTTGKLAVKHIVKRPELD